MVEADLMMKTVEPAAGRSPAARGENQLLLAALAAVLVDYREQKEPNGAPAATTGSNSRWRTLARWEQLRGRA